MATVVREAWVKLSANRRHIVSGGLASVAAVALVSGLVYLLRGHMPVGSLGALYILAVLPVAVFWGTGFAIAVSVASMIVFNYAFLPPILTVTLSGEENWLTLVVYLITGFLVSSLAGRARRRARDAEQREREAALLAELSTVLLSGATLAVEVPRISEATAWILGLPSARVVLGQRAFARPGERVVELRAGDRRIGAILVPRAAPLDPGTAGRYLPALGSLLGIALERERLAHEALEAEALRRSDSLKTALLRAVSHDLRSPLTTIKATLHVLENGDLMLDDTRRDALLASALAESERLDRMVRNLLDLSRLEAASAAPDRKLRTIDSLLDQALAQVGPHDGRIAVGATDDLALVHVDPGHVERALVNLLENALKFSPRAIPVEVSAERDGDEVAVRIADGGPGLASDETELVFEAFRRGSAASDQKGAGLGLAIARGFVEANGGRLWAEARPGGGACFVLAFPVALEPAYAEV